jgi:hypothetical protein
MSVRASGSQREAFRILAGPSDGLTTKIKSIMITHGPNMRLDLFDTSRPSAVPARQTRKRLSTRKRARSIVGQFRSALELGPFNCIRLKREHCADQRLTTPFIANPFRRTDCHSQVQPHNPPASTYTGKAANQKGHEGGFVVGTNSNGMVLKLAWAAHGHARCTNYGCPNGGVLSRGESTSASWAILLVCLVAVSLKLQSSRPLQFRLHVRNTGILFACS